MQHEDADTLPIDEPPAFWEIIQRFEDAWQRGERPAIDAYLPAADVSVDRCVLLTRLVHVDLERRLQDDASVRVESYIERYPELASDARRLLDLIAAEYELRRSHAANVKPEEYLQRFPRLSRELSSRLKAPAPLAERPTTRLHCPYCRTEIELGEPAQQDVTCPLCGSTFRVDSGQSTATWTPESLPTIGKFQLIARVGEGGFGTVFQARDSSLGRIVAVKIPRTERFSTREDEERFEREARAAASLEHPGIVRVLEFGRGETFPYIVSEFVQGISLADALTGRRFSFRETAQIVADVAEALDHAHQKKVIHRNVKPANIMLTAEEAASPDAF